MWALDKAQIIICGGDGHKTDYNLWGQWTKDRLISVGVLDKGQIIICGDMWGLYYVGVKG